MIVVLHLLVFLIGEGFLFHSPGFFALRSPRCFYHQVFLFLLSTPVMYKRLSQKEKRKKTRELIKLRNCLVPGQNNLKSLLISVL